VAAKVEDGTPCCDWVGEQGAGHYVKMVHNGIEYGDMQLICEAYNILKLGLGMSADEMHTVFAEWNTGELDSYLVEITRDILAKKDEDGAPMVDKILDTAGQKGTGKWTVINSQDLGIPITLMAEAVYSRCVSALKDERVKAARKLKGPRPVLSSIAANPEKKKQFIADIRDALYCLEDCQLCARVHVDARRGQRVRLEFELRRHCLDVARRLHYPLAFPRQDQGSL
jgi:6-phosphogluconate dehydrogenase